MNSLLNFNRYLVSVLILSAGMALLGADAKKVEPPKSPPPPAAPAPPAPKLFQLPEVTLVKFQNMTLREMLLQKEMEKIGEERNALVTSTCAGVGIMPNECVIDPKASTITRREPAKEAPPAAEAAKK